MVFKTLFAVCLASEIEEAGAVLRLYRTCQEIVSKFRRNHLHSMLFKLVLRVLKRGLLFKIAEKERSDIHAL